MRQEWCIHYRPRYGTFTKLVVYVTAQTYEFAMMKFYTKYDKNLDAVLHVEKL